jgi:hypothetical protein
MVQQTLSKKEQVPRDLSKVNSFVEKMKAQMSRPAPKLMFAELKVTYSVKEAVNLTNPKYAIIYATSVMVQKAMLAAGITTDEDRKNCMEAIGNLAGDFSMAAALGPETAGVGSILPLFAALLDSYDLTNSCFRVDGRVSHAVVANVADRAKQAQELSTKVKDLRKGTEKDR